LGQQTGAAALEPRLVHLVDISLAVESPLDVGNAPVGARQIYPVTGGSFEGEALRGTVLPGGADWLVRRPDGVSELDVRITMRTDDEQLIYGRYRGLIDGNPVRLPTTADAEPLPAPYWRITPIFETGSERYAWLNRIISVGVGSSAAGRVDYTVYAVR